MHIAQYPTVVCNLSQMHFLNICRRQHMQRICLTAYALIGSSQKNPEFLLPRLRP